MNQPWIYMCSPSRSPLPPPSPSHPSGSSQCTSPEHPSDASWGHSFTLQSCSQVRCHWPQHRVISVSRVQSHCHHEFSIMEVTTRMATESHKLKRSKFKRKVWMTKLINFHETCLASAFFLYELHTNFNFILYELNVNIYYWNLAMLLPYMVHIHLNICL